METVIRMDGCMESVVYENYIFLFVASEHPPVKVYNCVHTRHLTALLSLVLVHKVTP